MSRWDDPATAAYYEAFCRAHARYHCANRALLAHAHVKPGMRVLDLGAGTGRTAEHVLSHVGHDGEVVCVEPSAAMRAEGIRRVPDARLRWRAVLPDEHDAYDRVLCGAAIWQCESIAATLATIAGLLRRGGVLCFNIPAMYLQEPDLPGGGSDPLLLALPAHLPHVPDRAAPPARPLSRTLIRGWLRTAGYRSTSWVFRTRLTQAAYADWLKIPVVSEGLLGGLAPDERARRIDDAFRLVDRASWKWERWRGWTAWTT